MSSGRTRQSARSACSGDVVSGDVHSSRETTDETQEQVAYRTWIRNEGQDKRCVVGFEIHGDCAATGTADDHVGLALIVLGLGDPHGGGEVFVWQRRIQNFVAVIGQKGRFSAAWDAGPAVQNRILMVAPLGDLYSQIIRKVIQKTTCGGNSRSRCRCTINNTKSIVCSNRSRLYNA